MTKADLRPPIRSATHTLDAYGWLMDVARLLLAEPDRDGIAEKLVHSLVEATGAERGFLVVRDGDAFERRFDVRWDQEWASAEERRFSRHLVRHAIELRRPVDSNDLVSDPRFGHLESVQGLGPCAVLVVPLVQVGEVWGVLYLDRRGAEASFAETARALAVDFAELAGLCLRQANEREALLERARSLERDLDAGQRFPGFVTRHPRMLQLLRALVQAAASEAPVLILGESGTGKELLAQAVHLNSRRAPRPFVPLHCAALPPAVLESELFGHARGAFTGAERERKGRLAAAHGGTLFLDEVAEIPLEVQAKLLRFLQSGEIQRVGQDHSERLDVRLVAATNQDLAGLVREGRFRQDLYFRIRVIELVVPPLRERIADVPALVAHFLSKHWSRKDGPPRFSVEALRRLEAHDWPGNVRELENAVWRACALATSAVLGVELLPTDLRPVLPLGPGLFPEATNAELKAARERAAAVVERGFLGELLARCEGNVSRAARHAGIQRRTLQKLLARHGLQAQSS